LLFTTCRASFLLITPTPPNNDTTQQRHHPTTTPPHNGTTENTDTTTKMSPPDIPLELLLEIAENITDSQGEIRYGEFNAFLQVIVPHVSMQRFG
jgi:hypothetical protein